MQSKHGAESHLYPKWGTYRARRPLSTSLDEAGVSVEELPDETPSETATQLAQILRQALGSLYPRKAVDLASMSPPTVRPEASIDVDGRICSAILSELDALQTRASWHSAELQRTHM